MIDRRNILKASGAAAIAAALPAGSARRAGAREKGNMGNSAFTADGLARFASPPDFESGSGGLVSTIDDYLAFYRMLLAGGVHEGGRLLSRASVDEMRRDQLSAEQRASGELFLKGQRGWGLGMAVALTRTDTGQSPGTFGWNGGYGLEGHVDPEKELIGLLFTQRMMDSPEPPSHFADFWRRVYGAVGS